MESFDDTNMPTQSDRERQKRNKLIDLISKRARLFEYCGSPEVEEQRLKIQLKVLRHRHEVERELLRREGGKQMTKSSEANPFGAQGAYKRSKRPRAMTSFCLQIADKIADVERQLELLHTDLEQYKIEATQRSVEIVERYMPLIVDAEDTRNNLSKALHARMADDVNFMGLGLDESEQLMGKFRVNRQKSKKYRQYDIKQNVTCDDCDSNDVVLETGYKSCKACGSSMPHFDASLHVDDGYSRQEYKSSNVITERSIYEERTYLKQLIRCIETSEPKKVPVELVELIQRHFKRRRWTKPEDVTLARIRDCMTSLNKNIFYRKHCISKYYACAYSIQSMMRGEHHFTLSTLHKSIFETFFMRLLKVWNEQVKPFDRKNLLHYPTIVRRTCDLHANKEVAQRCGLSREDRKMFQSISVSMVRLKGTGYEAKYDKDWRKCVKLMGYPYVPAMPEGMNYPDSENEDEDDSHANDPPNEAPNDPMDIDT